MCESMLDVYSVWLYIDKLNKAHILAGCIKWNGVSKRFCSRVMYISTSATQKELYTNNKYLHM